jgi:hypothetical protein
MPNTITVELTVNDAHECASSLRATINRIDWLLENNPPKKKGEVEKLDKRAKTLTIIATNIEEKLNNT